MIQSRCGILCESCTYRSQMGCSGCLSKDKPFLGDRCPVKDCAETKKLQHCGECSEFPCALATSFAYDKQQGDEGKRLVNCRFWKHEESI